MTKEEITLDCAVCNTSKSVSLIVKHYRDSKQISVKKCTNCKHQYGVKEACKLNG